MKAQMREGRAGIGQRTRAVCLSPIVTIGVITVLLLATSVNATAEAYPSENPFIPIELSPREEPKTVIPPAPAAATPAPVLNSDIYVVQSGDTLSSIAALYKTSISKLTSSNSMDVRQKIRIGDRLLVGNLRGVLHRISSGESLSTIARDYNVSAQKIQSVNQLSNPNELHAGQTIFVPGAVRQVRKFEFQWPLSGVSRKRISSGYGYRQHPMGGWDDFHAGIDIAVRYGTPILAAESGKVTQSGRQGNYGNCVIIDHQNGLSTVYAHASRLEVTKGQYVVKGQRIGTVGSTGRSTGPHLHFEVRKQNKAVNPNSYLP